MASTRSRSRSVLLKVGLSWRQGKRRWDELWLPFLTGVGEAAASQLVDRGFVAKGSRVVELRVLRASAGRTLLDSILEDIGEADLLAFDLSPRPGERSGPGNVLIEVGAAFAMDKRVFLASSSPASRGCGCSDISGHYVAKIAGSTFDPSLRMALVHAVVRAWIAINQADAHGVRKEGRS